MLSSEVLIIGAGISGLLCATELHRAGLDVRLLDKGRGFGGRMATRRMAGGRLDHGAQYFTVRDPRLQAYVDEWLDAGVIREWFRHLGGERGGSGHPRYCGINGMTDVPKHLAKDLVVERSQQVNKLAFSGGVWVATSATGEVFSAAKLVLTAPLPQALALLDTGGLDYAPGELEALRAVRYERGLATLAILEGPSGLPAPGGIKVSEAPLTWIADNEQKGISPGVHAVTIHADAAFADQHWDTPNETRGPLMLEAAASHLKAPVVDYSCHRWGFTTPINPWHQPFFQNPSLALTLGGDAFGGPRVEGAALSGIAAAKAVLGG